MRYPGMLPSAAFVACLLAASAWASPASAQQGKAQIYLHRMEPSGQDADRFSKAAWGGGMEGMLSVPQIHHLLAFTLGFDISNLYSQTTEFRDSKTGLRVEQQTDQSYIRGYIGGRIGAHGNGFVRPFFGGDVALVYSEISTDVVVPDDVNRENEIRQNLRREGNASLGYDLRVGVDWNIANRFPVETGVRYLKSFGVPQQLGAGSVDIAPGYVAVYLAIGVNFHRAE